MKNLWTDWTRAMLATIQRRA